MTPKSLPRLLTRSILCTIALALTALLLTIIIVGMLNHPGYGWMLAGWGVVAVVAGVGWARWGR